MPVFWVRTRVSEPCLLGLKLQLNRIHNPTLLLTDGHLIPPAPLLVLLVLFLF